MTGAALDFGSLNEKLEKSCAAENLDRSIDKDFVQNFPDAAKELRAETRAGHVHNLMRSAGPISDAYILGHDPVMLITGPGGSGKTTASVKKMLVEAQRIRPGSDGVRRYVLGIWRQKYDNLWKATIPSYWKILPRDLPGSKWNGASPRAAEHVVNFEDRWGPVQVIARFRAFGDIADPEDLLGNEMTDAYLNEWPTLPEHLFGALGDRVGRDPPFEVIGRPGRFFGDANAPDVQNYVYRDFYETGAEHGVTPEGYRLYRQPGGLDPEAENIKAVGREYYLNTIRINAKRPHVIKRMVHAKPGFTRANMPCWKEWDDDRNMALQTIPVIKELPVIVGIDGGLTMRAVYEQERSDGQLRILAETSIERAGVSELAARMLAIEASPRFAGCTFVDSCDPSMDSGADLEQGSDRQRLSAKLGREVKVAPTQEVDKRQAAIRDKLAFTCDGGEPGLIVDPSCKTIRRGANQTYHFRTISGTDDVGNVAKTLDGHTCEAAEYGALLCGSALVRMRVADREREIQQIREADRAAPRYSPLGYARGRR